MKILSILFFMLTSAVALVLADQADPLPDFSKAFPKEKLWSQTKLDGIKTYSYATDVQFRDLKKGFIRFLGHGWTGVSMTDAPDDDAEGITGNVIFTNPKHPHIQVGLTQMGMEFLGKKFMVNITVLTETSESKEGAEKGGERKM